MIVTNNEWGISTSRATQHGEKRISDRGKAFGIECKTLDGNDPVTSYRELKRAMDYVRTERRPFLLEVSVSRLYGHSSSSGANFISAEVDCLARFEERLEKKGIVSRTRLDELRARITKELLDGAKRVRSEAMPRKEDAFEHVFLEPSGDDR